MDSGRDIVTIEQEYFIIQKQIDKANAFIQNARVEQSLLKKEIAEKKYKLFHEKTQLVIKEIPDGNLISDKEISIISLELFEPLFLAYSDSEFANIIWSDIKNIANEIIKMKKYMMPFDKNLELNNISKLELAEDRLPPVNKYNIGFVNSEKINFNVRCIPTFIKN